MMDRSIHFPGNVGEHVGYDIDSVALDRLHSAMELIFGVPYWGIARDIIASINRRNGEPPKFDVAITSAIEIFVSGCASVPISAVVLLVTAAWIWVS